jgi:hypothetical protein
MELAGTCTVEGNDRLNPPVSGEESSGRRGWLATLIRFVADTWLDAVFAVAIVVGQFILPGQVTSPDLDPSWSRAIQECFKTRAQAGTDYIFTYGPLGAFVSLIYDRDTYWYKYGWELAYSFITTAILVLFARRLRQKDYRFLFYAAVLLYHTSLSDLRFEFPALALAVLLLVSEVRVAALVLSGLFLATLCLVKFTFAVFVVPAILLVTAWKMWETRRPVVLLLPVAYGTGLLGLWLATGQALANFPRFVTMSMEIASGYVEAMSYAGPWSVLFRALAIIALELAACLLAVWYAHRRQRFVVGLLLVLAALYLQFRHGFIRHDNDHILLFFGFALAVPFVVMVIDPAALGGWLVRLCFGMSLVLTVQSFSVVDERYTSNWYPRAVSLWKTLRQHANWIRHPAARQAALDEMERSQSERWQMPRIKAFVGDHTIDMVSFRQGLLFLNGLRWTPRPIFQGYSAYTPRLLQANQDFYRSEHAPRFVLFHVDPIDGRLPATDDGGVLLELLHRYRPVMKEHDCLLLQLQEHAGAKDLPAPERTSQQTFHLGEEVSIPSAPEEYLTAAFEFQLKPRGRLLHTLYRNPFLYVNLRLSDGSTRKFRLVPGLAAHEFLLNPLVEGNQDVVDLYGGKAAKRIVSLSVTQEDFFGWHPYQAKCRLTLKAFPPAFVLPCSESELAAVSPLATLGAYPSAVKGYTREVEVEGQDRLIVEQGTITYTLQSGQHRFTGQYGIAPDACGSGKTDGVTFLIEYVAPTGERTTLFRSRLNPSESPADRGVHHFSVELPPNQGGGTLQLHTVDPPPHNTCWDWSFWSHIAIQ